MSIEIEVRDTDGNVLPGIPTPRLIEAGGGYAYFVANTEYEGIRTLPGVWYLYEEPRYVSKDGQYTRVRIVRVEEKDPFGD